MKIEIDLTESQAQVMRRAGAAWGLELDEAVQAGFDHLVEEFSSIDIPLSMLPTGWDQSK